MKPYCGDKQEEARPAGRGSVPPGGDWAKLRRSSNLDFGLSWPVLHCFGQTLPTLLNGGRTADSMSALLETSLGDIVIDLLVDESPKACEK